METHKNMIFLMSSPQNHIIKNPQYFNNSAQATLIAFKNDKFLRKIGLVNFNFEALIILAIYKMGKRGLSLNNVTHFSDKLFSCHSKFDGF